MVSGKFRIPIQPTINQENIFNDLKCYLNGRGYQYSGYTGKSDDSHKFGRPIQCYIKYISVNPRRHPPESLKVIIKKNMGNENAEEFLDGNDFYGIKSKHVFVIPGDQESFKNALRLINTIN